MAKERVSLDSTVCRSDKLLTSVLDDEVIMMDLERGQYYGLNKVASRIWAILEQPQRVATLCTQLTDEYAVTRTQCEDEVLRFVGALLDTEVLKLVQ